MGIVPSPIETLKDVPGALKYYHDQIEDKKGVWFIVEWLSFFLTAVTPIMGTGYFVSDLIYLSTQQEALRETLTLGLFLLAFILVPVLMIPYWAKYVIPFYAETIKNKIESDLFCFCCKKHQHKQVCGCRIFQVLALIIFVPILVILTFVISLVILLLLTFLKIDVWLLWIEAYRIQKWKMRAKVIINFRTNFEFVKDLLCIYINVVVSSYLLKWTPIAKIAISFRLVFIIKAIIDIVIRLGEQTKDYDHFHSVQKNYEQVTNQNQRIKKEMENRQAQLEEHEKEKKKEEERRKKEDERLKEEDKRRKEEDERRQKFFQEYKTKSEAEINAQKERQKKQTLQRQKQDAERTKIYQKRIQKLLSENNCLDEEVRSAQENLRLCAGQMNKFQKEFKIVCNQNEDLKKKLLETKKLKSDEEPYQRIGGMESSIYRGNAGMRTSGYGYVDNAGMESSIYRGNAGMRTSGYGYVGND